VPRYDSWQILSTSYPEGFRKHGLRRTFDIHGSLHATHTVLAELRSFSVSELRWAVRCTRAKHVHICPPRYDPWHKLSTLCTDNFRKHGLLKTFATQYSLPATHTVLIILWRVSVSELRWVQERNMCTFAPPVTICGTDHPHCAPITSESMPSEGVRHT
jgi:hypothetical protein